MSSILPPDFTFTQANLQDWVECRRRFQLRHLLALAWPAVEAEPASAYEARSLDGEAFHRLVHQALLGLPPEQLAAQAGALDDEPDRTGLLAEWWRNYVTHAPTGLPDRRHPELVLTTPLGEHRLVAKYDLVAVDPGRRAVIVDWKTSERRPSRAWLAARLQTRVYRYVLAAAGAHLNGGTPIHPGHIAMIYWFAEFPEQPEVLAYDTAQHDADRLYLEGLAAALARAGEDDFPLTTDESRCRFCPYRSLCGRGQAAGSLAEAEETETEPAPGEWLSRLDYEQAGEVAF